MDKHPNIKAAGYIRVSSKEQTEGESLDTQRQSIKDFCKQQNYRLTEIYADEGISGGTVKDRHALLRCLRDGQDGKFNVLVIHRLSRFGRNARELLINHDELEKCGITLRSISEGIDFGNKYGKAMLGMFAVMAELERDIIRETMLENRIAKGRKGFPTAGPNPTARKFNKETGKWELNEKLAALIREAAERYLDGGKLRTIVNEIRQKHPTFPSYEALIHVFHYSCGDTWTVSFKDEEPITYKVPRLLDKDIIKRIEERLEFNRRSRGGVTNKYSLTGFIRCDACGRALNGQTQHNNPNGLIFKYYQHPLRNSSCNAFRAIPLKPLEDAVYQTIFENIGDAPAFERAIAQSLPDDKLIKSLQSKITQAESELKRIEKDLDKLVDLALSGTLEKARIKKKETALLQSKAAIEEELHEATIKLNSMPDPDKLKEDAEKIRKQLLLYFGSKKHLAEMTFEDKQRLLHWLFDGKDSDEKLYGIYVNKRGKGPGKKIDYFLYGKIVGLRTLKDADINYQGWDEDKKEYKTNLAARVR